MRMPDGSLLSYCTNIHPGETWGDTFASLRTHLPRVKAAVAPGEPFGVGLRLSAQAAEVLHSPAESSAFQEFLSDEDLFVFTINGFPYGAFHGTRVKEDVYQPDWRSEARLGYSDRLADILVRLLPEGGFGSISTVPGTFKTLAASAEPLMAETMLRHVAHLVALHRETGKTIALAPEPEPCCFLETIAESVRFFEDHLYSAAAVARLGTLAGITVAEAETALRRHLGLCYDVCHAAVEFEDARDSLAALKAAGIPVHKLQLSAALRFAPGPAQLDAVRAFAEGTYLHQTVTRGQGGAITRYVDLPDAFGAPEALAAEEWRVHFHVPVFQADIAPLATTQDFLAEILALHRESPISPHLEVETYTWDVLPPELRALAVEEAIARELQWVKARLA